MLCRLTAPLSSPRVYLALALGGSFGLLLYSYWLVDFLPPTSKAVLLYTVLAGLAGTAGYFALFAFSSVAAPDQMQLGSRLALIAGSLLIGTYLAIAYLGGSASSSRYITFLLPRQSLRITVPAPNNVNEVPLAITRFTTSLGDVSYGSLQYRGWSRKGTDLVLVDPSNNRLEWSGRTGEAAAITFRSASPPMTADVDWNGTTQNIEIAAGGDGKVPASHSFAVPLYASRWFLLVLGVLDFSAACYAISALIWKNRQAISTSPRQSAAGWLRPATEEHEAKIKPGAAAPIQRLDWFAMAALFGLALLLRVFNLGNLFPYADEYSHLLAARSLLEGAPLGSVFNRSLLTVTLPVVASLRIFGLELWAARLPGVLFNALAVFPLYLLARKINRPIAILSGVLYASSPLIIGVSRNVREYAYYPAYFYAIAYTMTLFLERLPGGLILFRDWKRAFRSELGLLTLVLLAAPLYAIFVDARSTFKIIMIAYAVFAAFLLAKFDLRNRSNVLGLGLLGVALAVGGSLYAATFGHSALSVAPDFHIDALAYFFPSPAQQWYFDRPAIVPLLAILLAGVISFRTLRRNRVAAFMMALVLACAVFFTVFFGHYLKPRYVLIMELWYVVVLAIGLYGFIELASTLRRADVLLPLVVTALFALTFNVSQTLLPTLYDKQGNMPVTGEYHYNIGPAYSFLLDRVSGEDALVSTIYGGYVRWKGAPQFKRMYSYSSVLYSLKYRWIFPYEAAERVSQTPQEYILGVVAANPSGWIVLDSVTYSASLSKPLSLKTAVVGDKQIDYVGYFGGEYIWRWHAVEPSS